MMTMPIVEHFRADPPRGLHNAVERLAKALREERPELTLAEPFHSLAPKQLAEGPTLHIDDLSEIPLLDGGRDARFYQDRARLRAGDNDLVVSCADPIAGHEAYCRDYLSLGSPAWLRPAPPHVPLRIAEACWEDGTVRARLIEKLRRAELLYLHPNMGTFSVWELAFLLHRETLRPIQVIAPPPGVTRWANDKIAFSATVSRLFGPALIPRTESAWNLAYLTKRVNDLADEVEVLALKLPRCAGGAGNLVADASQFRGKPLPALREMLKDSLRRLGWDGSSEVLIDRWETEVVCSPSAQLWIPPESDGPPVVEGIFVQTIDNTKGVFVGNVPADFSSHRNQEITDRCWLLARLFQNLGYVGRCSFDMILVGDGLDNARLEFVECNGRWGGTSLPMTLMNRIFGDWRSRPYAVQVAYDVAGLDQVTLTQLLEFFRDELFDVRTGHGSLIFYNPGRLHYQSGISTIVLGNSLEEASGAARLIPGRLREFAQACQ